MWQQRKYEREGAYHRPALSRFADPRDIRYHMAEKLIDRDLSGSWCLDFGGGDSVMGTIMSRRGAKTVVADPVELALKYAKEEDPRLHPVAAKTVLPFSDNQFRIVTMLETLEHIPNPEEMTALQEIYRVLQPDGTLILSVPSDNNRVFPEHYRHYSQNQITEKVKEAGLTLDRVVAYRYIASRSFQRGRLNETVKTVAYAIDQLVRKLPNNMGLVACSDEQAFGYMIKARKK